MSPDDPRHGTIRGYSAHRRSRVPSCAPCRRAMATHRQMLIVHGPRLLDATGTHRRIQALAALGYTLEEIANACGWPKRHNVDDVLGRAHVQISTRDRVTAAYDALCMTIPDDTRRRSYLRRMAARKGWLPPLAWDDIDNDPEPTQPASAAEDDVDEVLVRRILTGDAGPARAATNAERRQVVARWAASGRALAELARLTGWKPERYRPEQEAA